jgi:hypothetical protein
MENILKLVKELPNDMDLGREVRKFVNNNKFPNDSDLGKHIRKISIVEFSLEYKNLKKIYSN